MRNNKFNHKPTPHTHPSIVFQPKIPLHHMCTQQFLHTKMFCTQLLKAYLDGRNILQTVDNWYCYVAAPNQFAYIDLTNLFQMSYKMGNRTRHGHTEHCSAIPLAIFWYIHSIITTVLHWLEDWKKGTMKRCDVQWQKLIEWISAWTWASLIQREGQGGTVPQNIWPHVHSYTWLKFLQSDVQW